MLQEARETVILPKLAEIIEKLTSMAHDLAAVPMMSRTHGQPATPTTLDKETTNIVYRLQRQFKNLQDLVMLENGRPAKETRSIKMALMGPLAGIGDSLSQFCLAPLFSTIAASFAQEGLVVGPILFFLAMNTILTAIKLSTGLYGYKLGTTVIDKLSEQMATISRIANIIGVTVIAGLAATSVKIMVPITFAAGEVKADAKQSIVSIQGMLDKVAPALLPALFTLLVYYLIKEKKWTTYKLVILTVIIGIIGSWLKILA